MIYTCSSFRRFPEHNINQACTLKWAVRKSLSMDAHRKAEKASEEIGTCLDNPHDQLLDLKRSYGIL